MMLFVTGFKLDLSRYSSIMTIIWLSRIPEQTFSAYSEAIIAGDILQEVDGLFMKMSLFYDRAMLHRKRCIK